MLYRVEGIYCDTGERVTSYIDADSEEQAATLAKEDRIAPATVTCTGQTPRVSTARRWAGQFAWWNINIATWICVIATAKHFYWAVTHWPKIQRFASDYPGSIGMRIEMGHTVIPLVYIGGTLAIWTKILLPREWEGRNWAGLWGIIILLVEGFFRGVLVLITNSVYDQRFAHYKMDWPAVYFGASLVVYASVCHSYLTAYYASQRRRPADKKTIDQIDGD